MSPWARILPWWTRTISRGQGLDLGQDVARDEDGPALALEVLDEPDELALAERVEPAHGLVQDDDPRIVGDGLGELDPLAHAPAVAADEPVLVLGEIDDVEGPGRPVPDLGRPRSRRTAGGRRRTRGRSCPRRRRRSRGRSRCPGRAPGRSRSARPRTVTVPMLGFIWPVTSFMKVDLPGAVRAEEAGDALLDLQADVVQAEDVAVPLGQARRRR